jgi:hypothetical protein
MRNGDLAAQTCDKLKMTRAAPLHSHPAFGTDSTELNIRTSQH